MLIDEFIISVYCCVEDLFNRLLRGTKLRQRGFAPKFTDIEILTIEIIGEFLGIETDKQIWEYFKRHWNHWFPKLPYRTTFCATICQSLANQAIDPKRVISKSWGLR